MTNPAGKFGIYLHTPFCVHKCSYCDFYSFTKYHTPDFSRLAQALEDELAQAAAWLESEHGFSAPAESLFFGGGTPSLVPLDQLERVFAAVTRHFPLAADAEITLEANPETVNDALCEGLKTRTPVNRISMGAQSFKPEFLKTLERLGSRESILAAAATLKRHGFTSFNLDLIFAIPGQTLRDVLDDIDEAVALSPRHISFYNLTLKPGHTLYGKLPSDDLAADMYEAGVERLARAGYRQYEISNFAQPGFESRHNLLYWNGGDYLGVGPSAASRFFWNGVFHHRKQLSDLGKYLAGEAFPAPGFDVSSPSQTVLEATFLELRRNDGVDVEGFRERYGYDLTKAAKFPLFVREGLLVEEGGNLRLTARGRMLADSVTRDLVDL